MTPEIDTYSVGAYALASSDWYIYEASFTGSFFIAEKLLVRGFSFGFARIYVDMLRVRTFFILVLFFVAVVVGYIVTLVNPVIFDFSRAKIEAMTVKAVNRSVNGVVGAQTYRDVVDIRYDTAGKITSLTTNMVAMNGISSDIAVLAQSELELLASFGIEVPVGTFSGLPILTGKGPVVRMRVVPVGSVNCSFFSEFSGAGINQTRHRIVLLVNSAVNLIMPLFSQRAEVTIEVMLCESVIIGEVPEFLFNQAGA